MAEPGEFPFELTFAVALCDCGAQHPLSTRCSCGAPAGADELLDVRRTLVRRVFASVAATEIEGTSGEVDARAWFGRVGAWLPQFLGACQLVSKGTGADELLETLTELEALHADTAATPKFRPHIAPWRALEDAIAALIDSADLYLIALTTADKDEAVRAGAAAQAAVDLVTAQLDALNERQRRWEEWEVRVGESDSTLDPLLFLVELVWATDPAATITEFDASGQHLVAQVTGGTELPSLGVGFLVLHAQAAALMDPTRLWATANETYCAATAQPSSLVAVTSSPSWRSDLHELTQELVDMGVEMRSAQFDVPRLAARSFIRCGHLLTERVGKYLLASLLAVHGSRDYEALRAYDVAALLNEAAQAGFSSLTRGWDKAIRHADAHKLFVVEDEGVTFTADKREYDFLTWDELADRVLSAYESVLAVHAGLVCALEAQGLEIPDPLLALDVADEDRIRFNLAAFGWTDITVDLTERTVKVTARVGAVPVAPAFAAAIVSSMPQSVTSAEFTLSAESGAGTWSGPVAPLRRFGSEKTELAKRSRLLEVLNQWTLDGAAVLSTTRIRAAVAAQVATAGDEPASKLATLDVFAASARRLNDRELVATLGGLRRGYEAQLRGRRPAPSFKKAVDALAAYYDAGDTDRAAG